MPDTPTTPPPASGGRGDDGGRWVGEWVLDPEDAVYDMEPGVDSFDSFDVLALADEEVVALAGPVTPFEVAALASIDPSLLSRQARVAYLRRMDAVKGYVASLESRALVAVAGTDASDSMRDRHVAMEVAVARRVGEVSAASSIATARALHVEFPAFRAALEAGEISETHCRILVGETVHVTDPGVIAALQDRLLRKAQRRTPGEFRRDVRAAVADLDAAREAERHALARADRHVACTPLPDGMGRISLVSDWATVSAIKAVNDADGRAVALANGGAAAARAGNEDALADAARANAFAARFLGTERADGSIEFAPAEIPVSLTLVMDLDTLQGTADRHALLDGEPVPADVARDYAGAARTWRRAVTDPVTGHLLDYGREQYLPDKLRDYITARDHCRAPGCTTRAASRLQMDHAIPFPEGPTSSANTGGLCVKHHQLKTARLAHLLDTADDGSATWLTALAQRITIPPRPFLHDPADTDPPRTQTAPEPAAPAQPPEPPGPPTWPGGDVRPPWRDPERPPF